MRRTQLVSLFLGLCLLWWMLPAWAGNTHDGTADIALEQRAWWGDALLDGYVVATPAGLCLHGTSPSTSATITSCRAYALNPAVPKQLEYIEEMTARTITYSGGNGTYWLIAHASISATVSGWTRIPGTHYLWQLNATQPPTPTRSTILLSAVVSSGAILSVTDVRTMISDVMPGSGLGSGNVQGPASSTPNAVARFSDATGQQLENSTVTIDNAGVLTAPGGVQSGGTGAEGGRIEFCESAAVNPTAPDCVILGVQNDTNLPAGQTRWDVNSAGKFPGAMIDNVLPLSGGTLTGKLVVSGDGIQFLDSDIPFTCTENIFGIWADQSEQQLKVCNDGVSSNWNAGGGGAPPTFDQVYDAGRAATGATSPTTALQVCGSSLCSHQYQDGAGIFRFRVGNVESTQFFTLHDFVEADAPKQYVNSAGASCFQQDQNTRAITITNNGACAYNGVTTTATQGLDNKTFDTRTAGNVLLLTQPREFPFAQCIGGVPSLLWDDTPLLPEPIAACNPGTNRVAPTANFDALVDEGLAFSFDLPADWMAGVTLEVLWRAAAITGTVSWGVQTSCYGDGQTPDPSFNPPQYVSTTVAGTTLQRNRTTFSSVTMTNCLPSRRLTLQVFRDGNGSGASDTMVGDALAEGVIVTLQLSK